MRICIDMRMAGTGEGIARYAEELAEHLARVDNANQFFLLYHKSANSKDKISNPRFRRVYTSTDYYSFAEQTKLIFELRRLRLDLVHFPSFNAPIFYPGKFIVTIHDIIHHYYPGKKKSRFFHRLAYRAAMRSAIKRSRRIIAVSTGTKDALLANYAIPSEKISVVYEGVGNRFQAPGFSSSPAERYGINKPYIFFVGVWRQYKNLPRLAAAFDILREQGRDLQLVLAGKIDPFYPEIKEAVLSGRHAADIKALGFVAEEDLPALYHGASAFVLPSLIEGFGLIGVEAQAAGVPVAASSIPVLREVLGEGAVYFDPEDSRQMAEQIDRALSDQSLRDELIRRGRKNTERFDWEQAARETLKVYQESI